MHRAGRVVRIAIRALATALFALVVGICGGWALDAPVMATNDYEPGAIVSLLVLTISVAGARVALRPVR
jgi:predicted lysophospholipase L1 biosynthesis ABC-type transport system permease subunit